MRAYLIETGCTHEGIHSSAGHDRLVLLEQSPGIYFGVFVDDRAQHRRDRPEVYLAPFLDLKNPLWPVERALQEGYEVIEVPADLAKPLLEEAFGPGYWGSWYGLDLAREPFAPPATILDQLGKDFPRGGYYAFPSVRFTLLGRQFSDAVAALPRQQEKGVLSLVRILPVPELARLAAKL